MKYFPPLLDKENEKCRHFVNMVSCNYSVFSESRQARICKIILGIRTYVSGSQNTPTSQDVLRGVWGEGGNVNLSFCRGTASSVVLFSCLI